MIRSMVGRILQKVPDGERKGFDLEHWWRRRYPRLGTSLAEAFEEGDRRLTQLSFVISEIESMLFRSGKIVDDHFGLPLAGRSEEHTSELQSLMRISYAVFCLKKKN